MDDLPLLDSIYECAFLPQLWPRVLDRLAEVAGARGGILFAGTGRVVNWTASDCLHEMGVAFASASEQLLARSQRQIRLFQARHAGFIGERDIYREEELALDPFYTEFLWPRGFGWAAGTAIAMPTGDNLSLSFERERASGPADAETIARLDQLRPHIARSVFLAARQNLERARAASETLAAVGLPAIVMNTTGTVLSANHLTESLSPHIIWRASDKFALADHTANDLLQRALTTIHADFDAPVRSFAIRDADLSPVLIAHVLPLRGSARDIFAKGAAVLVMTQVTMPQAPATELIQSLFDLTAAEARVARGLVAGDTVDAIAKNGSVSAVTVRTQLRGVLAKTGCRRQAEVVALLAGVGLRA